MLITVDKDRDNPLTSKARGYWVWVIRWAVEDVYLEAIFFVELIGKEIKHNANKDDR